MTIQQVYEEMRGWFSRPDAQFGMDREEGTCRYRVSYKADDPGRCGVGSVIPNELYDPAMDEEGETPASLRNMYPELRKHWGNSNAEFVGFLEKAQQVHDSEALTNEPRMDQFLARLDDLATEYGLKVPISSTA